MIEFLNTAAYIILLFLLVAMITFYSIENDKVYFRNLQEPFDGKI